VNTERANVLQIVHGFGLESYGGGAERFAFALSRALDPERFRVVVCGLWSRGDASEDVHINGLRQHGLATLSLSDWDASHEVGSFLDTTRALHTYLRQERIDIVHSHCQFGDIAALIQAIAYPDLIIVRTPHDGHRVEWRNKPWRRLLLSELLYPLRYDAEVGVSSGIVKRLDGRPVACLWRRRAVHIPNAIDLSRFRHGPGSMQDRRDRFELPEDAIVIGSVGRLAIEKGYDLLLQAISAVLIEVPEVYLVLVGGGQLADDLTRQAHDLGISEHVRLTGPQSDVEEILPCFDLFVSSSRWEGLSTVVLESMASGVPVVATAVGGTVDIVDDSHNGWLVPPENPRALAKAILAAIRARCSWNEIARRALLTARAYSIDTVARQHEEMYQSLLQGRKPGRLRSR